MIRQQKKRRGILTKEFFAGFFKSIISILYPSRCPVCGKIPPSGHQACPSCYRSITFIQQPYCYSCGKPLSSEEIEFCHDCTSHPKSFVRGFSLAVYDSVTKSSLSSIKYKNKRQYLSFYVAETTKNYGSVFQKLLIEAILPVPIHPKRYKKRGFNQAALFAEQLGKILSIPVYDSLLIRKINTLPQKNLSPEKRLKNLKRAFDLHPSCKSRTLPWKRVLLVDDIYTTGATMEAITQILLAHGVQEVYVFSICIGKGF